jgi:hypothetical protein
MIFRLAFFGILLVAAMLALYFFTRKKWDWNSYAGSLAIAFSALLIIPLGMFAWVSFENRLQTQNSFADIELGATTVDVKFLKGEPVFKIERPDQKMLWRYQDKINPGNLIDVIFQNGKVKELSFTGPCQYCEKVNGFGIDTPYDEIVKRFGKPGEKIISADELEQRLNYPEYNSFFVLKEGKVIRQGIYQ